jgi:hypothetical protein
MDRHKLLLRVTTAFLVFVFATSIMVPDLVHAAPAGCSAFQAQATGCSGAQASGNSVDVWANQTTNGAGSGGGSRGGTDARSGGAAGTWHGPVPYSISSPWSPGYQQQVTNRCYLFLTRPVSCFPQAVVVSPPVVEAVFVAPTITVGDITSFSPTPPTLSSEPQGWAVVGLESNMIATTGQHVATGQLLGAAAEVRFTPLSFDFTYGDGASRGSPSPGASWAAQGLPEFAPTSTSHIYSQTGSYLASVRVGFTLEYRWGSGAWTPIEGRVHANATNYVVVVVDVANVLVREACQQGTSAPGC